MFNRNFAVLFACLIGISPVTADSLLTRLEAGSAATEEAIQAAPPLSPLTPMETTLNCLQACESKSCCPNSGRVWGSIEGLYWAVSGNSFPALVTASPAGTPRAASGVLGLPSTVALFGGAGRTNNDFRTGARFRLGTWLDECSQFGIEADYFFLGDDRENSQSGSSDGSTQISRPFFNPVTGRQDSQLVSFPGATSGFAQVDSTTHFEGWGARFLTNLSCNPCGRTDLSIGYRSLKLSDRLSITENLSSLPGSGLATGTQFQLTDLFETENQFHGLSLGLNLERRLGRWFLGTRTSIGLGVNQQTTTISGSTSITSPGMPASRFGGGLLTQSTNIGRVSKNVFSVVPEVGLRTGFEFTPRFRAFVGYDFLFWSNVSRTGDQIDTRVNPSLIAPSQGLLGPSLPSRLGGTSGVWAQGFTFGLDLRF
jgi:hypothetical protein